MANKIEQIKEKLIKSYGYAEGELKGKNFKQLEKLIKDSEQPEEEVLEEEIVKETPKKKRVIGRDELIPIMNNTNGTVIYTSKTSGQEWVFNSYGQTDDIEMGELIKMKNAHPRYLNEPWIIILDEDAVQQLGLSNLYENVMKPEELDNFFKLPVDKFNEILNNTPSGMKQLIVSKAMKGIKDGSFDSMSKIKAIEESYGIRLREE
jgi:hypothetical protein